MTVLSDGKRFSAAAGEKVTAGDGDGGCASVRLSSSQVGHTQLTVKFSYTATDGTEVVLQDSVVVASYLPLVPAAPASGQTVMAKDSSRQLAWAGGPLPWPPAPSYHASRVAVADTDLVQVISGFIIALLFWQN